MWDHTGIVERDVTQCPDMAKTGTQFLWVYIGNLEAMGKNGSLFLKNEPLAASIPGEQMATAPCLALKTCVAAKLAFIWVNPLLTPVPSGAPPEPQSGNVWDINRWV